MCNYVRCCSAGIYKSDAGTGDLWEWRPLGLATPNRFNRVICILCRRHVDVHKGAEDVNFMWTHVYGDDPVDKLVGLLNIFPERSGTS